MTVTSEMIMAVATALVTYIFGLLSKKFNWIESQYIPVQNFLIGVLTGIISYILKINDVDLLTSIICCLVGSMASGGTYDLTKTKSKESEDK